jgi:hypothetical protein
VLKEAMLNHPEATVAWVEALPAGPERDRLIERSLRERLDNVPSGALFNDKNEPIMRLFDQLPLESQQRAATGIAQKLAQRSDFSDLRTILNRFTDETSRYRAMIGAFSGLSDHDGAKAEKVYADYVASLPPGPAHDVVTSAFAMSDPPSPVKSIAIAQTIRDPSVARSTLDSIVSEWFSTNPRQAREWLTTAKTLPPDFVKKWQTEAARQQ